MTTASDLANTISTSLLAGTDFNIDMPDFSSDDFQVPEIDLTSPMYAAIEHISNADLTAGAGSISGSGTFDLFMQGFKAHLKAEYDANRISGAEYTKAYIACTESAMSNAVQFLVSRDATYWAAVTAQLQAQQAQIGVVTARVQLETAKTQLQVVRIEALTQQVNFALGKLRLATENVNYDTAAYNLANIQPQQLILLTKQIATQEAQNDLITKQTEQIQEEIDLFPLKESMMQEQIEVQRAQTMDTRTDGTTPVDGVLGKQKELYAQQITSYQRDSEVKVAKIFSDAWITMKTIDEGLEPPDGFTNTSLDEILTTLKTNNSLG